MGRHKNRIPEDFDGVYTEDMLTDRQRQVLDYIRSYSMEKGYPPSVREICKAIGLSSTASVHNHLRNLQAMGFIQRDSAKPRAIELKQDASWRNKTVVPVPLVGTVTAGKPILAVENIEETYPIPKDLIGTSEDVFMLSVNGDSMIGAGILDHDYLVVRQQNYANNGDIVVALIDGDADGPRTTVKRYFKDLTKIRLHPENEKYNDIIGTDNIHVIGKVIGVFRML
ncbi:MAG: transcriptional repressor LexA [Succiniclasticum sp.]|jgi:repressor LexA